MTTIVNKNSSDLLTAYRNNKPKNGTYNLFLIKDGIDIPIAGFHIFGTEIYVVKTDFSEVLVELRDSVELRN
jgi:hypothetical protein